jgi:monoamine oxidase
VASSSTFVDVVVVGGGYSGLSAAWALSKRGHSVIVLEARDRVGGRAWTQKVPGGGWVDNGGQWIGPGQTHIFELAKEVGVGTFPTFQTGHHILVFGGERLVYSTDDPTSLDLPVPKADLEELLQTLAKIDMLSKTVPSDAPWEAARAEEWDTQTAATWMKENIHTDGANFALHAAIVAYFSVEPSDLSFLHLLFYISAAGGLKSSRRAR